jgi:putative endonuclease
MPYYVYILLCKDGSYYTGHAKDVERRVERHKKGQGARYTRMHKPEKIVFLEKFANRSAAMKREREIKSLNHSKKQQLINLQDKTNPANSMANTCS